MSYFDMESMCTFSLHTTQRTQVKQCSFSFTHSITSLLMSSFLNHHSYVHIHALIETHASVYWDPEETY